jgi:K(+)-stimulated pyrophosphate-energized sodium pump
MFFKRGWVVRQDAGSPEMKEIADAIADGALAFLKAEWRVLIVFGIDC